MDGDEPSAKKTKPTTTNNEEDTAMVLQTQMQGILDLMTQRAQGNANTAQVESAVSEVLATMMGKDAAAASASASAPTETRDTSKSVSSLQMDDGNYDDDDDDEETTPVEETTLKLDHKPKSAPAPAPAPPPSSYFERLDSIPMGKVGAQMMTTFGDGPYPNPDALTLALEGTRRALQLTSLDARALRRKIMGQYKLAKREALSGGDRFDRRRHGHPEDDNNDHHDYKATTTDSQPSHQSMVKQPSTSTTSTTTSSLGAFIGTTADAALVYRAYLTAQTKRHDPLGKNPPCGFDTEQLAWLYPEELRAYERWNELHAAYDKNSNSATNNNATSTSTTKSKRTKGGNNNHDGDVDVDEEDPQEEEEEEEEEEEKIRQEQELEKDDYYVGGHLKERAAVFDHRTVKMPTQKYMNFAKVRQGSFLARGIGKTRSALEKEWEECTTGRHGRGRAGSWWHLPPMAVRFLHWLGYDPPEVPAPDKETTQVLAFLGYDRMGRIVEKAIYLRNIQARLKIEQQQQQQQQPAQKAVKNTTTIVNPSSMDLRKLPPGEQLTVEDIRIALEDPEVKPAPLFHLEEEKERTKEGEISRSVQLYFGPGFEQRLELELEEMLASSKQHHDKKKKSKKRGRPTTSTTGATTENPDQSKEAEIQRQERELLQKMSRPLEKGDGLAHLLTRYKKESEEAAAAAAGNDESDES